MQRLGVSPIEKSILWQLDLFELDPCVVQVVAYRLPAHITRRDTLYLLSVDAKRHEEGVRAEALAVDQEIGNDNCLVSHDPLRNPVLVCSDVWAVECKGLRGGVPGRSGVDDEA